MTIRLRFSTINYYLTQIELVQSQASASSSLSFSYRSDGGNKQPHRFTIFIFCERENSNVKREDEEMMLAFQYDCCLLIIKVPAIVRGEKTLQSQSNSKKVSRP